MSELVSVIVPVYNAENYLVECINSILAQTYTNLELILVNDGSTDNSLNLCRSFVDSRIKVVSQANKGVSGARNRGIAESKGEYLMFVDSDDFISNDAIGIMTLKSIQTGSDIVVGSYSVKYPNYTKIYKSNADSIIKDRIVKYAVNNISSSISSSVCMKLYKKKIITHWFNEDISMGEDLLFNLDCFKQANRIDVLDTIVYTYNRVNESSLTRLNKIEFFEQVEYVCSKYLEWAVQNGLQRKNLVPIYERELKVLFDYIITVVKKGNSLEIFSEAKLDTSAMKLAANKKCKKMNLLKRVIVDSYLDGKFNQTVVLAKIYNFISSLVHFFKTE